MTLRTMTRIVCRLLRHVLKLIMVCALPCTAANYEKDIRPLLTEYCLKCHSTEKHKGDLDLEQFSSVNEVKKHPKIWQTVVEQLSLGEMPPKDKPQPSTTQREQLLAWANAVLNEVALEQAGDPGPVVLRRLSNAEYTYTVRDLIGVESLEPAREFPVDGAAGEGFMNVGNSLVMSPSLVTKYLDAGKELASHAMLLPDGIRFSPKNSRRDWTEEIVSEIRTLYREYSVQGGGTAVNLQGIKFDTKDGGVIPLEKYFAALLEERASGQRADVLRNHLSAKYLNTLRDALNGTNASLLLEPIRARWRTAKPGDATSFVADIAQWQRALWKFNSVGHIGKKGGPKAWLEPFSPVAPRQEVRFKVPSPANGKDVVLYLTAGDAGDGNANDFVVWQEPRLLAPGKPALLLRDVRDVTSELMARREKIFATTEKSLAAAAEASTAQGKIDVLQLANKHGIEVDVLNAWLDYLGLITDGSVKIESYFTNSMKNPSTFDFISGWGGPETPNLVANSSDQHVRIPGNMKPHSVAVHPSPKLQTAVGWRSPMAGPVRVEAVIQHAHPECGNGVTWALELRRGTVRQRLGNGFAQGSKEVKPTPIESLAVRPGDLLSLLIGPRDGNHSCDLTAVDLILTSAGQESREWNLAKDVSPNVIAANPHADRFGNEGVWHFYIEPDKGNAETRSIIPAGSPLAKWQASTNAEQQQQIAGEVQKLLTGPSPASKDSPDAKLYQQLSSLGGPLLAGARSTTATKTSPSNTAGSPWGIDRAQFGKRADGSSGDGASLYVRAPSVIEVHLPADLVAGCEFVTTGVLDQPSGREGSVQLQVLTNKPPVQSGLRPAGVTEAEAIGPWYSNNRQISHNAPIVVADGSAAQKRVEADLEQFRQLFPAALCYMKIVPVDEVITLMLHYREDQHLARLMLDETQAAKLDRLWNELTYVSQDDLKMVDVFEQLWQYATQDADPSVFEPVREPIKQRAAAFREFLTNTQPKHVEAVLEFASRAYRRPLNGAEKDELRSLYRKLRSEEIPHEEAIRLTLARVLVAPAFLYHAEKPGPGKDAVPVSDWELASRLSYFLWSSTPDAELSELAASGKLRDSNVLVAQSRRMLRDARVRRLAKEFGCAWLHIYDFDELSEKSERHFPTFTALRGDMYEETIRFFTDLFQNDRPVRNLLNADYTFLNEPLARHYGIPFEVRGEKVEGRSAADLAAVTSHLSPLTSDGWRRVDGVKKFARGGILAQSTTLAKQSGASRTSPILRGNWVSEVLLGEKLPRPPKDVPRLPEDEATETLTVRQLTEKHTTDSRCAGCHARIDAFGFALEKFDAIGRHRERDLGDRTIDTHAKVLDGSEFDGIDGLRDYLLNQRGDAFLKQFCRKLLGYSLGRAVQLSDTPLIDDMMKQLKANDYRVSVVVEAIVRSKQFREIRGREMTYED